AQPMAPGTQLPAPADARFLYRPQAREPHGAIGRVAVADAEDAFAVADELADAAYVESGIGTFHPGRLRAVVAQGLGAVEVERPYGLARAQADEVVGILAAFDELRENEELLGIAERHELAAQAHRADVERAHVPRQVAVRVVRPEHLLCAVGHVLVTKGTRAHRFDHRAARRAR